MKNFVADQRLGILAWNTRLSKYIEQSVGTDLRCYISIYMIYHVGYRIWPKHLTCFRLVVDYET